ncbi:hypothetical protein EV646_109223 [Kribbella antiqua]|uniref:Uncharacterized protein n=1 Tax=Kribbella antiqua TaxID=2512217 RepID=A0A4R2IM80_9ACTN|nr:hypothetical protein [Kribbella antiqua]TCO45048.1 hypothetical protein EV646_109223 [Kribbella antiqua]
MPTADPDDPDEKRDETGDDLRDLNLDLTVSRINDVVVHHQLHPNEPLDAGDMAGDDMRTIAAHALVTIGRDPAVGNYLARPRSVLSRLIAFILGCALVTGLYLGFGWAGVFGAGYLVGPLVAPGASLVLARRIFSWVYSVRLPKRRADGLTVLNYFTTGLGLTVCTIFTATGSWLAEHGLPFTIPFIVLVFVLVVTPMYYLVVREDYDEADPPG